MSQRFTTGLFKSIYKMTVGLQISARSLTVDNILTKLVIWDTAGQERYDSLVGIYYRDASIVLMVYDCSNLESIERLHFYFNKI